MPSRPLREQNDEAEVWLRAANKMLAQARKMADKESRDKLLDEVDRCLTQFDKAYE